MARIIARDADVFIGGRDVSGRSNSTTLTLSAEAPEVTSFGETYRTRLASGIQDAELTVDGFFDSSASEVDESFYAVLAGSVWCGMYPQDATASHVGYEFGGILTNYEPAFAVADAAATSITVTGACPVWAAKSLAYTTVSAVGSSQLTSVDFSGSGGTTYGVLRLLTLTGGGTPVFSASLQESTADVVWVTIAVLSGLTAACQVQLSAATSASRYRRVSASLAGTSPCATFMIASASVIN